MTRFNTSSVWFLPHGRFHATAMSTHAIPVDFFCKKSQVSGVAERSKPSKFSHHTQHKPSTYNNN